MKVGFWNLKDEQGHNVRQGDTLVSFRGEAATMLGGTPPHKPSSTGRVYVQTNMGHRCEFFPSVYNLTWQR